VTTREEGGVTPSVEGGMIETVAGSGRGRGKGTGDILPAGNTSAGSVVFLTTKPQDEIIWSIYKEGLGIIIIIINQLICYPNIGLWSKAGVRDIVRR